LKVAATNQKGDYIKTHLYTLSYTMYTDEYILYANTYYSVRCVHNTDIIIDVKM